MFRIQRVYDDTTPAARITPLLTFHLSTLGLTSFITFYFLAMITFSSIFYFLTSDYEWSNPLIALYAF